MSGRTKREYLKAIDHRYQRASPAEKGQILDEFCQVCGCNRKYAIRLLNRPLPTPGSRPRRRRPQHYSQQALSILLAVWEPPAIPGRSG